MRCGDRTEPVSRQQTVILLRLMQVSPNCLHTERLIVLLYGNSVREFPENTIRIQIHRLRRALAKLDCGYEIITRYHFGWAIRPQD